MGERVEAADRLPPDDLERLRARHRALREAWRRPVGLPGCVVHGDARVGNVARTAEGPLPMDFERASVGAPEWDLVSTAVKTTTTGGVSPEEYATFHAAYGHDVTRWEGYELFCSARELRMVTYAAQHAADRPEWRGEARHRIDCPRGRTTPRPWKWTGSG